MKVRVMVAGYRTAIVHVFAVVLSQLDSILDFNHADIDSDAIFHDLLSTVFSVLNFHISIKHLIHIMTAVH